MDFWLFNIPQIWWKGHELGLIIYTISMSVIAASVFYILTNHYREYREKKHIYPYVKQKLTYIIKDGISMFSGLAREANVNLKAQYPTTEELSIICELIHPLSKAPLTFGAGRSLTQANWKEYFGYIQGRSKEHINKILNKLIFLEPDIIELLGTFEDNVFFVQTELLKNIETRNEDLKGYKDSFDEYIILLKKLEEYRDNKMQYY